jgi:hypothetical protein
VDIEVIHNEISFFAGQCQRLMDAAPQESGRTQ